MAKRVVKVQITGYYLVSEDLPEDVLGTATIEEYIAEEIKEVEQGPYDILDVVQWMLNDMATKPTIRLELKED